MSWNRQQWCYCSTKYVMHKSNYFNIFLNNIISYYFLGLIFFPQIVLDNVLLLFVALDLEVNSHSIMILFSKVIPSVYSVKWEFLNSWKKNYLMGEIFLCASNFSWPSISKSHVTFCVILPTCKNFGFCLCSQLPCAIIFQFWGTGRK